MTNEEAIVDLEILLAYIPIYQRFYQSISMGIKALKQVNREQEPCEDAISRQAVLDLLFNSYIKTELTSIGYASKEYAELCVDELNDLPSVNPQEPNADVLDKMRAEIDSHCSDNRDRNDGLYIAMKIIDKYRESEG